MPAHPASPAESLAQLAATGLLRTLSPVDGGGTRITRGGRKLISFASNDYLGLSQHPRVIDALSEGARKFGAGSGASRLVSGSIRPHHDLEDALAGAKGGEAALAFSSGFATAMGCIPAIVGKGDTVIIDKLGHACLIDAARASGATLRVFPHNDVGRLEDLLERTRRADPRGRILVITESVFSMDGDVCPLRDITGLCGKYGALLWLDEAHATGVVGPSGLGLAQADGLADHIDFQMGTLGKALGVAGGYLVASRAWIDLMINRARAFIYSTAPPAALAVAAREALAISCSAEGDALRHRLRGHLATLGHPAHPSAILPIILGGNAEAMAASATLADHGFLVPAIRYPTVSRGTARLRVSVSATHDSADVAALGKALGDLAEGSQENP